MSFSCPFLNSFPFVLIMFGLIAKKAIGKNGNIGLVVRDFPFS